MLSQLIAYGYNITQGFQSSFIFGLYFPICYWTHLKGLDPVLSAYLKEVWGVLIPHTFWCAQRWGSMYLQKYSMSALSQVEKYQRCVCLYKCVYLCVCVTKVPILCVCGQDDDGSWPSLTSFPCLFTLHIPELVYISGQPAWSSQ